MSEKNTPLANVLVIDDEAGLRSMLVFSLTDRGYHVISATSGEEAIQKARRDIFELVLCDIMMPGKSGVEVLEQIKLIQPETEVIMATGYATLETAVDSMKKGAYDYIAKPYSLDQLCLIFEKALEHRRLKKQIVHLEELNRMKSEFLATTSHELRTPMNAIIGYTELLLEGVCGDLTLKQKESLVRVDRNAKDLLHLINDILDYSQLAAGRMSLLIERCDLQKILDEVAATVEPLARTKGLQLRVEPPGPLVMQTDKAKLRQVLINLVANGIKFTSQGYVSIRVEPVPSDSVIRISVQDTGIGIKTADFKDLFQDFKQLDGSASRRYGGTGLGLSICKRIVELFRGSISVQSQVGQGTTFTLTLPMNMAAQDPSLTARAQAA